MSNKISNRRDFFLNPLKRFQSAIQTEYKPNPENFFQTEDEEQLAEMTSSVLSDFSHDDLVYEVMSLGMDPSNMEERQMKLEIMKKMDARHREPSESENKNL